MKSTCLVLSLVVLGTSHLAKADPWNEVNDPAIMDTAYEYNFAKLPLNADLPKKPWAETYWESALGSINIRWNEATPDGFKYALNNRAQVMQMTRDELAELSPSEKWDLYLGHYDYPLHHVIDGIANPHTASWHGMCNGWSMSAVQFDEPQPKDLKNPDGVMIPFGSSDIKGLLSYYAQFEADVKVNYVGGQCHPGLGHLFHDDACADINPGAMHVVLANQLGLKKQAFMMDRDPGPQIWNQPVYGFTSTVTGSAVSKAAQGVQVHTSILYTDELDKSSWTAVGNTPQFTHDTLEMDYILDLDASGNIVGGSYINGSDHPDLFWQPQGPVTFQGDFVQLKNLL
jgi:hypothetical protein